MNTSYFLDALASLEMVFLSVSLLSFREILDQSVDKTYRPPLFRPYNLTTIPPYNLTTLQPYNLTTLQPSNLATLNPTTLHPDNLTTSHPYNYTTLQLYSLTELEEWGDMTWPNCIFSTCIFPNCIFPNCFPKLYFPELFFQTVFLWSIPGLCIFYCFASSFVGENHLFHWNAVFSDFLSSTRGLRIEDLGLRI